MKKIYIYIWERERGSISYKRVEYIFFSSALGTFSKVDHMQGHKTRLNKFKKAEIISSIFSDHDAMREKKINYILKMWMHINIFKNSKSFSFRASVKFSSIAQSCPTLCNLMDYNMPGLPVHHQHLEFIQTHVHWDTDVIQPSQPLSFLSHPAFNLSQHQGLFKWVSCSHRVAKVLEFLLQHQSLQWTLRTDFLWDGLYGSPCSPRDSQEFSPTSQFKSTSSLALSFLYSPTLTSIHEYWKNHNFD